MKVLYCSKENITVQGTTDFEKDFLISFVNRHIAKDKAIIMYGTHSSLIFSVQTLEEWVKHKLESMPPSDREDTRDKLIAILENYKEEK